MRHTFAIVLVLSGQTLNQHSSPYDVVVEKDKQIIKKNGNYVTQIESLKKSLEEAEEKYKNSCENFYILGPDDELERLKIEDVRRKEEDRFALTEKSVRPLADRLKIKEGYSYQQRVELWGSAYNEKVFPAYVRYIGFMDAYIGAYTRYADSCRSGDLSQGFRRIMAFVRNHALVNR